MPTTPLMGIELPTPTETPGPDWANDLNKGLGSPGGSSPHNFDGHTHQTGYGAPINAAAIDIDADLNFNGFAAYGMKRVTPQATMPTSRMNQIGLWQDGANVYWFDGINLIQITANGGVNPVTAGNIPIQPNPGPTPAGVSALYTVAGNIFQWFQSIGKYARMAFGRIQIFDDSTGTSPKAVTISAKTGLSASYGMELPDALPASPALMVVSSAGKMSVPTLPIVAVNTNLALSSAGALVAGHSVTNGPVFSGSSAADTGTSSSFPTYVTVPAGGTAIHASIMSTGRPIFVSLTRDGFSGNSQSEVSVAGSPGAARGYVRLFEVLTSTEFAVGVFRVAAGSGGVAAGFPPSSLSGVFIAAIAGTEYTFQAQYCTDEGSITVTDACIVAYEIG